MRYLKTFLKLFESENLFSNIKPIYTGDSPWTITSNVQRERGGTDFFTRRELSFFRNLFDNPSDKHDFFKASGIKASGFTKSGEPVTGERRSVFTVRYMPKDNKVNPIKVIITRFRDDYYLVNVSCIEIQRSRYSMYHNHWDLRCIIYLIDNFEDLQDFLNNLDLVHTKINNLNRQYQYKPKRVIESNKENWYEQIDYETYIEFLSGESHGHPTSFGEDWSKIYIPQGSKFNILKNGPLSSNPDGQFITIKKEENDPNVSNIYKRLSLEKYIVYQFNITKYQDDWFVVQYMSKSNTSFYKCDTYQGVNQLIKDLI